MGIEAHDRHAFENDIERESNFKYRLFDLYAAAGEIKEGELRETTLDMCDNLKRQSMDYLTYVTRFMEGSAHPDTDHARRNSHNGIISSLRIITRILGPTYQGWYDDEPMHGGLGGDNNRKRMGTWALYEALTILEVQLAKEEDEKYGSSLEGNLVSVA